jgi:tRNA A-37 threonylcarbamoyl transferase component Bud32
MGVQILSYPKLQGSHELTDVKAFKDVLGQFIILHKMKIVHGDVLPRNLLFYGGKGFVIDFDLSREVGKLYVVGYNYSDFHDIRH